MRMFQQFEGLRVSPAPAMRPCRLLQAQRRQPSGMQIVARQSEVGVGLFGTKAGMTQIFTPDGLALPATVIALEQGNVVAQVKTGGTDGYSAVQVRPAAAVPNLRTAAGHHLHRPAAAAWLRTGSRAA